MLRKQIVAASLFALLYTISIRPAIAESIQQDGNEVRQQVEKTVAKSGLGEKARVTVRLQDKSEVKGYISQLGDSDFVVIENKTSQARTRAYTDVRTVKGNRSRAAKIAIGAGVAGGILFGFTAIVCARVGCSN